MIAKLVVRGQDRNDALRRFRRALEQYQVYINFFLKKKKEFIGKDDSSNKRGGLGVDRWSAYKY